MRPAALMVMASLVGCSGTCSSLGTDPVSDGSRVLPVGDLGVGPREGGCPALPGAPSFHFAARLESYAHNDTVATVNDFGSIGQSLTAGVGNEFTFLDPCESGVMNNRPCFSMASDLVGRPSVESDYNFMHDGSGASCYWIAEFNNTTSGALFETGAWSSANTGALGYWAGTTYHGFGIANGSSPAPFGFEPNSVNPGTGVAFLTTVIHGTSRTPDWATWRDGTARDSGNYAAAPSVSNPTYRLVVGGRGTGANRVSAELYEMVCYSDVHDESTRQAVEAALSCVYGSTPQ